MKPKTLLILTTIVGLLGAVLWLWERDLPSSEERGELAKRALPIEADAVTGLTIVRSGTTTRFERTLIDENPDVDEGPVDEPVEDRGSWRLVEPIQGRADSRTLDGWLASLAALEKKRTLDNPVRSDLGLDEPRASITVETDAGRQILEIGADVPASENVIVARSGGDEAMIVDRSFLAETDRSPSAWRDPEMFTGRRDRVDRIQAAMRDGVDLTFVRRADAWFLESPIMDRADSDRVDRLLGDLVGLRASEFIDEAPEATAATWFDPATAEINVAFTDGDPAWRLELATVPDDAPSTTYGRISEAGQLLTFVTNFDLDRFGDEVSAWRSPSWTEWQSWQVESFEVSDDAGSMTVSREGSDWSRDGESIYFTSVSDLIAAVTAAEAERFIDGEVPAGEPTLTLVLVDAEAETETLSLHPSEGGAALASSSSRPDVLLVLSAEAMAEIQEAVDAIRNAEIKSES